MIQCIRDPGHAKVKLLTVTHGGSTSGESTTDWSTTDLAMLQDTAASLDVAHPLIAAATYQ